MICVLLHSINHLPENTARHTCVSSYAKSCPGLALAIAGHIIQHSYKPMRSKIVLGISLGTKYVGLAVYEKNRLTYYRVKTFYGRWNAAKLKRILATIDNKITRRNVTHIAFKVPEQVHGSGNIEELVEGIHTLCSKRNIQTKRYSLAHFKRPTKDGRISKRAVAERLIQKHPELTSRFHKEYKYIGKAYYFKMFEAIACAEAMYK